MEQYTSAEKGKKWGEGRQFSTPQNLDLIQKVTEHCQGSSSSYVTSDTFTFLYKSKQSFPVSLCA